MQLPAQVLSAVVHIAVLPVTDGDKVHCVAAGVSHRAHCRQVSGQRRWIGIAMVRLFVCARSWFHQKWKTFEIPVWRYHLQEKVWHHSPTQWAVYISVALFPKKKAEMSFTVICNFICLRKYSDFRKKQYSPLKKKKKTSLQEKVLHSKPCLSESTEALTTKCTAVVNMQRNQPCHHHISTVNTDASMHNITLLHILYLVDLWISGEVERKKRFL